MNLILEVQEGGGGGGEEGLRDRSEVFIMQTPGHLKSGDSFLTLAPLLPPLISRNPNPNSPSLPPTGMA